MHPYYIMNTNNNNSNNNNYKNYITNPIYGMDHKAIVWCHYILDFITNVIVTITKNDNDYDDNSNNNITTAKTTKLIVNDILLQNNVFLSNNKNIISLSYKEKVMLQEDLLKVST